MTKLTSVKTIFQLSSVLNKSCRLLSTSACQFANTEKKQVKPFGSISQHQISDHLLFRQLFEGESWTYTYLLADTRTKEAVLIDPVIETGLRDARLINELGLTLKYCINTHMHADHITGSGLLKKLLPGAKSMIAGASGAQADIHVRHGDKVTFGDHELEVRSTPGHTNGCVTYVIHKEKMAFTGDALLIRGCGRTDFQEGDPSVLYDSIWQQILSLAEDYRLYPGHDYNGLTVSSVAEETAFNPRVTKSREQFVQIMKNLNLEYPRKLDVSIPANRVCGLYELPEHLKKLFD